MDRRTFLQASAASAVLAGFGHDFWRRAYAAPAVAGVGPYGAPQAADANGIRLPPGFHARVVARTGQRPVASSSYQWHAAPDGGACFPARDGGWVYVSNSEVGGGSGGAGALRFGPDGTVTDAYPVLLGTSRNCAGGRTPWGTWLSCEEVGNGQVYECDPFRRRTLADKPSQLRAALGGFSHEAVAVDPVGHRLYLTEDAGNGRLYRFTPSTWPDLGSGQLQVAVRNPDGPNANAGVLTWVNAASSGGSAFNRGEGIWYDEGWVYFTTTGDNQVWAVKLDTQRYEIIYSPALTPPGILRGVDNVFVSPFSGDIYVAEDGGSMDLVLLAAPGTPTGPRLAAPFLTINGQSRSEITGPAMSPDGKRMYLSSQRGTSGAGITYEITGPFRNTRTPPPVIPEFPLGAAIAVGGAAVLGAAALALRQRPSPEPISAGAGSEPESGSRVAAERPGRQADRATGKWSDTSERVMLISARSVPPILPVLPSS